MSLTGYAGLSLADYCLALSVTDWVEPGAKVPGHCFPENPSSSSGAGPLNTPSSGTTPRLIPTVNKSELLNPEV